MGTRPRYLEAASALGRELAERQITLVYGGARIGLMGALADAALEAGGEVIGVLPKALMEREGAHPGLTELRIVTSMHERKALTGDLADGFIALPGGLGTLEELLEMTTWFQLGIHSKPLGALNVDGYYDLLFRMLDHAVAESFLMDKYRQFLLVDDDPGSLLRQFDAWQVPS